jgi:hypothetical protein
MIRKTLLFALLIALFAAVTWAFTLAAQEGEPSPEETPEPVDCSTGGIAVAQAELTLLLRDFGTLVAEDEESALATLYDVGTAYRELALACGHIPDDIGDLYVGEDIDRIMTALEAVPGDPLNGQLLYNSVEFAADGAVLGCAGCHMEEDVAPLTEGTWTRWDEIRSLEPQFADYTFERYIVESIVLPWDYTVPGYPDFTMPNNFGERLSFQDLVDIIAFLNGQDQFLD